MAVYAVSDIHGHLKEFEQVLDMAGFKQDGTDELHILGDLIDWGTENLATVRYVMELCRKCPFAHCYKGNHDLFLQQALEENKTLDEVAASLWADNNGYDTYKEFINLAKQEKQQIISFISGLPISSESIMINEQQYVFAHAGLVGDFVKHSFCQMEAEEAVWRRWDYSEKSVVMKEKYPDAILVSGHTITNKFYKHTGYRKCDVLLNEKTQHMFIDCGCKIADRTNGYRLALVDITYHKVYYSDNEISPLWDGTRLQEICCEYDLNDCPDEGEAIEVDLPDLDIAALLPDEQYPG